MKLKTEWIQQDDFFSNPLFRLTSNGLRYYGLLLSRGQQRKRLHNLRGVLLTMCMWSFIATQYVDLYQVWGDFDKMTENATTNLLYSVSMVWVLKFYWNRTRFNALISLADEGVQHILSFGTALEKSILWDNVKYVKRLAVIFWGCALLTTNGKAIAVVVQHLTMNSTIDEAPTFLRSWYPGGNKRANFVPIFCLQVFITYLGLLIIPCWHMFVMNLMVYVRTGLTILNYKLEHLDQYLPSELRTGRKMKELQDSEGQKYEARRELLIECIQIQSKLNEFTSELQSLIQGPVLLDFIVYSMMVCTVLFAISVEDSIALVFVHVSYIQTILVILFLYYWHANEIDYQYNLLSSSAFKQDWYNYPSTINKSLSCFICYSNKSRTMKAFFVPMSLETFIGIIRASYSYFTILKQMAE